MDPINQIIQDYTNYFAWMPGIISVGLGQDISGEPIIRVSVERDVYNPALIPDAFGGIPVEVRFGGPVFLLHAPHNELTRPLQPGVSVSSAHRSALGTLGGLIQRGDKTYIISNNHVLAGNDPLAIGQSVFQPGRGDGTSLGQEVGFVKHYDPFDPDILNRLDIAIAEVTLPGEVEFKPIHYGFEPTGVFRVPAVGDVVSKSGRTTSYTSGLVLEIEDKVHVNVSGLILEFSGCINVSGPFVAGGDSGSWAYDDDMNMVGMVFAAGSDSSGWLINPLEVKAYIDEQVGGVPRPDPGSKSGIMPMLALVAGLTVLGLVAVTSPRRR